MACSSNSLSKQLFEGTAVSHRKVEQAPFIHLLLSKKLTAKKYSEYLIALYYIYSALEDELDKHQSNANIQQFSIMNLKRIAKISEDLQYFNQFNLAKKFPSKATKQYVNRIQWCSKNDPDLLIAHIYVRYLGDLSGGQIIKKRLSRTFQYGLSFYDFEEDSKVLKSLFRSKLDALQLDEKRVLQIVEEANLAFKLSGFIFSELLPLSNPTKMFVILPILFLVLPLLINSY